MWNNALCHFSGNHKNCNQKFIYKYSRKIKTLQQFYALYEIIDEQRPFISNLVRGETTNYNEAYHSVKAKFLSNFYNFGVSTLARLAASILQYNEGYLWIFQVLKRLHMRLIPYRCLIALYHFLFKQSGKEKKKVQRYHKNNDVLNKRRKKRDKENKIEKKKNELKHK